MNSCEHYQELISRLVDADVSNEEYDELLAHMNTCSRCSALYAVFYDLSAFIGSEEPPELPEGLHENIMAGVRRSEIEKKNRRVRSVWKRTALTAAACAALALFAVRGLSPRERAEEAVVRSMPTSEEAAADVEQSEPLVLLEAEPQPAAPAEDAGDAAQPAPVEIASPAPASAEAPEQSPAPELAAADPAVPETPVPAAPAATEPEPEEQSPVYEAPAVPEAKQPEVSAPVEQPETPAPGTPAVETEAPVQEPAPTASIQLGAAPQLTDSAALPEAPAAADTAVPAEDARLEDAGSGKAAAEAPAEEAAAPEETEAPVAREISALPGLRMIAPSFSIDAAAAPDAVVSESPVPSPSASPEAQKCVSIRIAKDENRQKLQILLSGKEASLPGKEADKTYVITLIPSDAYGSEETLTIGLYGSELYYQSTAGGKSKSFSAACSVTELEELLKTLAADEALPSPSPSVSPSPTPVPTTTPDPYLESPAPAESETK